MFKVIDVNVIISSLLKTGNTLVIFALNNIMEKYEWIAPEYLIIEIGKHTQKIIEQSHLSLEEVTRVMIFLTKQINFISEDQFKDKFGEARTLLKGHEKDVYYLALALKFNCEIFSGDLKLKDLVPNKVNTPKELLSGFYS